VELVPICWAFLYRIFLGNRGLREPLVDCKSSRLVEDKDEAVAIEQARHYLFLGHGEGAITGVA
jgi:hypothetical protein